MKKAPINMIYEAASRYNILALTSRCAASCIFCSHHQNPSDVEAFFVSDLTMDEAVTAMEFLDGNRKIIIGESATRLCEGEPFIHTDFIKILKLLRKKYKNTPIQITTSGIYLDEEALKALQSIGNIELNISLNSCSREGREKLFKGSSLMEAVEAVMKISSFGIAFNGSIVAMPHLVGEKDLEDTIMFLSKWGAETIRIFMPGYTKYCKIPNPPENMECLLRDTIKRIKDKTDTPILMEPALLEDLKPVVEGVINDSPAKRCGLMGGDLILRVNGKSVFSRVDAYYKALSAENPEIEYLSDEEIKKTVIPKASKERSGLIFNYDIDMETIDAIRMFFVRNQGKRCVLLTSKFAYDIMAQCFKDENIPIKIVENRFFGGNIGCCGLLVLEDVKQKLAEIKSGYDVVFLPSIMFDSRGRDLTGRHYKDLEEEIGINTQIV